MGGSAIVDEEVLERELKFLAGKKNGEQVVTPILAQILLDIAKSIPSGYGEEWREDCVAYAAFHLTTNVVFKYEVQEGSRAFNYFYTSACFAAMKEYRRQQKQRQGDVKAYHISEISEEGEEIDVGTVCAHLKKDRDRKREEKKRDTIRDGVGLDTRPA